MLQQISILFCLFFLIPSIVLAHGGVIDEHTYTTTANGQTEIIVASVIIVVIIAAIIFFIKRKKP